jgi:hypothetical protein
LLQQLKKNMPQSVKRFILPYPKATQFPNMHPYNYQNAGDWTWFGGRMIAAALVANGQVKEAYHELEYQ